MYKKIDDGFLYSLSTPHTHIPLDTLFIFHSPEKITEITHSPTAMLIDALLLLDSRLTFHSSLDNLTVSPRGKFPATDEP